MTENPRPLSICKEEPESNVAIKKMLKRKNSIIKKNFVTKKSLRHSLDISGLIKKRTFQLQKPSSTPVDLCLRALEILPKSRDNECLNHIVSYLKSLPNFMNIISKEKNMKISENLIEQISIHLRHEFIPKNNLVCRFGEKGEKFYIILKGKVVFIVPKPCKCYLNLEEYILYLMQLRKNNEFELIENLLVQNRIFFPIEDDDLDLYLINEYEEYQKYLKKTGRKIMKAKTKILPNNLIKNRLIRLNSNVREETIPKLKEISININNDEKEDEKNKKEKNKKKYFSPETYKKMEEIIEIIKNPKLFYNEDPFLGIYNPRFYIKSNNVVNAKLDSKGRKLVNIFNYEEMSVFENGQNFGFIALQSKNSKRAATAIVVEDSDLGVLTKDEYLQFFEILSSKEKKNLYELLKFYNLITTVSEYKFIKRYYHMFEYIKYHKNNTIMDPNKKINDLIVFNSELFVINICVNIPELNDLMTKLRIIKGKLLGLSKYKIEKELEEKRENQDMVMRKNYISKEEYQVLIKKYNYTLSLISDHLIIGYPDTVDPATHLPLFNCKCLSAESDAYLISNRSITLINEESVVIHNLKDFCLMKIEYNLNRLKQFKKEILIKSKKNEIPQQSKKSTGIGVSLSPKNKERAFSESNITKTDVKTENNLEDEENYYVERNQTIKKKSRNNSKIPLSFKFNDNLIETLNNYKYNIKIEENKNYKDKDKKKININQININLKSRNKIKTNNSDITKSKTYIIKKLRESIMQKQKKIELKREHYFKIIEDINQNKKEKMKKKLENSSSINGSSINNIDISINNKISEYNYGELSNRDIILNNNQNNNINSISLKNINIFKNNKNLLKLPPIEKMNEKNKLYENFKTESNSRPNNFEANKKFSNKKNNEYISYDDLYKMNSLSPSLVKDKYIIFKHPDRPVREDYISINNDFRCKPKSQRPVRLTKDNCKNLENCEDNDNENKKLDYINIVAFNNQTSKKVMLNNNIKEKYNELNNLVKSLQKTTNEILDKKDEIS